MNRRSIIAAAGAMCLFAACSSRTATENAAVEAQKAQEQITAAQKQLDEAQKKLADTQAELDRTVAESRQRAKESNLPPARVRTGANRMVVPEKKAEPLQAKTYTIPAGKIITVRTTRTLTTKSAQPGEQFDATLIDAIVDDGFTIAERGATVTGEIVDASRGGRVKGRAELSLALTSLTLANGRTVPVQTTFSSQAASSSKKTDAAKIGIGAGIGAAIGAIAGGGKGAAIGAAIGGGGGTALVLGTRGSAATVPAESVLSFELRAPVNVTRAAR